MTTETSTYPKASPNLARVPIILSALWAARTFSSLQGDAMRLSDPATLKGLIEGATEFPVTGELLLAFSPFLAIPIFMTFLSLTLNDRANRWINLIAGTFFLLWDLVFMFMLYVNAAGYEVFWGSAYLLFATMIVWYAWTWPKRERLHSMMVGGDYP